MHTCRGLRIHNLSKRGINLPARGGDISYNVGQIYANPWYCPTISKYIVIRQINICFSLQLDINNLIIDDYD